MSLHTAELQQRARQCTPGDHPSTMVLIEQGELHRSSLPIDLPLAVIPVANWSEAERIAQETFCCVLVDLDHEPEATAQQLSDFRNEWVRLSCIACSANTTIRNIVSAMRAGCVDFVAKPIQTSSLMAAVDFACRLDSLGEHSPGRFRARLATLTDREAEVLKLFVEGQNTKVIAKQLGVSYQTIDKHRNRALKKMHVGSLIDLTRILNAESLC